MSDREFTIEIQKISEILNPSTKDKSSLENWEERLEALKKLINLAREDVSKRQGFLSIMSTYLKVPLQRHIEELRTILSSEACLVIITFAKYSTNRSAWQIITEWFIPSLLHMTSCTKKISVNSASETLKVLAITNSFGSSAFIELLRGCHARHAAIRNHAFKILQIIIQQSQNNDGEFPLSKYIETLCKVIREGLIDADAETRKSARECYWAFHATEIEAANIIYNGLENSVKRALTREQRGNIIKKKLQQEKEKEEKKQLKDMKKMNKDTLINDRIPITTNIVMNENISNNNNNNNNSNDKLVKENASLSISITPKKSKKLQEEKSNKKINNNNNNNKQDSKIDAIESWVLVQDALRSTSWSQRLLGLQRVSEDFIHYNQKTECIKLLIPRLNDPNVRVSQAAIQVIKLILRISPNLLKDELPDLITSLLVNVSSHKEILSIASRELLANIIKTNAVDDITHAIYRTLEDVVIPKVKVHALEYVQYIYTKSSEYFTQLTPMKQAMHQMLLLIQNDKKESDVYKACVAALTALYVVAKTSFLRSLLQLTSMERDILIETLEITIPHLSQECRRRSLGERILQHPTPQINSPFADALAQRGNNNNNNNNIISPKSNKKLLKSKSPKKNIDKSKITSPSNIIHNTINENTNKESISPNKHILNDGRSQSSNNNNNKTVEGVRTSMSPKLKNISQIEVQPVQSKNIIYHDPNNIKTFSNRILQNNNNNDNNNVIDILDRLEEVYGAIDNCALLDRIKTMISINPNSWLEAFGRLLLQLEKLIPFSSEPDNNVRRRAISLLHTAVSSRVLQRPICRYLKRIILLARIGIDDVFPEVQIEAVALLQLILNSGLYSTDHCLNALAVSLENWLKNSNELNYSSRGWLTLLESIEHIFIQLGRSVILLPNNFNENITSHDKPPGIITEAVFHRVCNIIVHAIQHNISEVRLTAVLVCVSIWISLDSVALPYFVNLTASQRKLVSIYYNKIISERIPELQNNSQPHDMGREMRIMGLPEATRL